MIDTKSIIVLILPLPIMSTGPVNAPELFGKEEHLDKLVIKNQIAYHFKKVVREVKQELFVSRRIDASLLFAGIQVLQKTEAEVRKLCESLPDKGQAMTVVNQQIIQQIVTTAPVVVTTPKTVAPKKEPFVLVASPFYASFKEAKARCVALGMQLPEIYSEDQKNALLDFMKKNAISQVFAGIEFDFADSIPRHISTQYPIWKTVYDEIYECHKGHKTQLHWLLDDGHAKYLYTSERRLCATWDTEGSPVQHGKFASHGFREHDKTLSQMMARIVCTPKWEGTTDIDPPDQMNRGGINVKARYSRSVRALIRRRRDAKPALADMKNVQTLCFGVADQAKESYEDMQSKMTDLLALVDITAQITSQEEVIGRKYQEGGRQKRVIPLFLMKFIFVTGVKLLWQLFGFVQKVKMNNRLKSIESMLAATNNRSMQNSDAITSMTKLIQGNSFAINQLSIRVDGLEKRINLMEVQLGALKQGVDGLTYRFETVTALVTIDNLVSRTRRSMDTGYDILKDIIHNSIQKQTSPLVLPLDQIELVQNTISKESTAILDPDFAKMQSIVVSDPSDPSMLLVVVNVAALDRRNLELVHLVPIPYFEGDVAYEIILDYQHIVLDQATHAFSILSEQEENDCLLNRCYIGSTEQSLLERSSCGIPQFYDQYKKGCTSRSIASNGVFLKPMLPDGVLFALKSEVRSEVFCMDKQTGRPRELKGTGILQLPNGCILQVIDLDGKVTRVKGLPQHTMVNAGDFKLVSGGPLKTMQSLVDTNDTQKTANINAFVEAKVSSVIKQVEKVDNQMLEQHKHVWYLTGTISLVLMLIVLVICLLYRYSTRARRKIRVIKENFSELKGKVLNAEIDNEINVNVNPCDPDAEAEAATAPPPQRRRDVWLRHLRDERERHRFLRIHRHHQEIDACEQPDEKEFTYMNMSEVGKSVEENRYMSHPSSRPITFRSLGGLNEYPREYPRIPTPMVEDAKDYELERLKDETELTEQLREVMSPKNVRRFSNKG